MRRQTRNGVVAAALVVVVGVPVAGWMGSRSGTPASAGTPAPTSSSAVPTPEPPSATATSESPLAIPSPKPTPSATKAKPHATPTTKPAPSARKAFSFPVPVSVGDAQQVITVKARGSYATVVAWQLRAGSWHAVAQTTAARVGTHGVVPAASRKQGTGTTPAGTFTLTEAFGISADPGTAMPYHQVTSDDWWVEDNNSAYYNEMRRASQGGFAVTTSGVNGSEHLVTFTTQYRYVVVINFNRPPNAVRYRGAGIFLHVNGPGSTAGCVSVPLSTMVAIIDWLSPAQHPRIAIA